jgi:hypothetical protein
VLQVTVVMTGVVLAVTVASEAAEIAFDPAQAACTFLFRLKVPATLQAHTKVSVVALV